VFATSGTSVTSVASGFTGSIVMNVLLTSDDGLTVGSASVAWDNAGTTAGAGTVEWTGVAVAFNMMVPTQFFSPTILGPAGAFIDNAAKKVYAFDGLIAPPLNPPNLPAGTYQIGTVVWNLTGATSNTNISSIIQFGIDGFGVGGSDITGTVSLGGATINVVPEPGTASLLGLGLIGLIMAGRRNRA
jgi:hypothetical protein